MISRKLQEALNDQIVAEMWSSNLYLSMAFYFAKEGYEGFSTWMKAQAMEELGHALKIADYMTTRDGEPKINMIDVVPTGWGSPLEIFEAAYKHECHVSGLINNLVDIAIAEKDKATQEFLMWFVKEQVEEEATAKGIVDKIKLAGQSGLFFIDTELGKRK